MTLTEYLSQFDTNIFDEIQKHQEFPFLGVDTDNIVFNNLLLMIAGERHVRKQIQTLPLSVIAGILVFDFASIWTDIGNLDIKLDGSIADELRIMKQDSIGNTAQTNSINNVNKVSAYDSDELVIDDGSTQDGSTDSTNKNNTNVVEEKYSFGNIYNNLSKSQQMKIHRKVINDIVDTLTLSVY